MKNRTIFALLLAVILAVPVFAQQTSTTQAQPAAQTTTTKVDNATGKDPLQPDTREGFWGHLNPFARKKYVARQTQPIRDRINELDELTASNTKSIKDTDARAQQGIQLASAKANEADQHAIDAGNRAQAAQQTATTGAHPPGQCREGRHQHRSVPADDSDGNPVQVRTDRAEPEREDRAR